MPKYVPNKGDFVSVTCNPQSDHRKKVRRPALVISNYLFNKATGLAAVCPITPANRKIPFHVQIPDASSLKGVVMVDQVKSIDFTSRRMKFIEKAPPSLVNEVLSIFDACIY
jgi:mRNA interferase MazF